MTISSQGSPSSPRRSRLEGRLLRWVSRRDEQRSALITTVTYNSRPLHRSSPSLRSLLLLVGLVLIGASTLTGCGSVPQVTVHAAASTQTIASVDDSLYAHVLVHALTGNGPAAPAGSFSLTRLRADTELTSYLEQLARVQTDAFLSHTQELAFWINAYNAYALDLLRSNQPARLLSDIPGFHSAAVALIGGRFYSLDDIATIMERRFREPRAFFALHDGSRSAPHLRAQPYADAILSDQLETQVRDFLADSTKNLFPHHASVMYLSSSFHDYEGAIVKVSGDLLSFIRGYAPPTVAQYLQSHPSTEISYLQGDETINTSDITQPSQRHDTYQRKPAPKRSSGGIH